MKKNVGDTIGFKTPRCNGNHVLKIENQYVADKVNMAKGLLCAIENAEIVLVELIDELLEISHEQAMIDSIVQHCLTGK